ncbi:Zinc finger protein [Plecturocebus cupreus]
MRYQNCLRKYQKCQRLVLGPSTGEGRALPLLFMVPGAQHNQGTMRGRWASAVLGVGKAVLAAPGQGNSATPSTTVLNGPKFTSRQQLSLASRPGGVVGTTPSHQLDRTHGAKQHSKVCRCEEDLPHWTGMICDLQEQEVEGSSCLCLHPNTRHRLSVQCHTRLEQSLPAAGPGLSFTKRLALLPRPDCSGAIIAHCILEFLGSTGNTGVCHYTQLIFKFLVVTGSCYGAQACLELLGSLSHGAIMQKRLKVVVTVLTDASKGSVDQGSEGTSADRLVRCMRVEIRL